MCPSSPTLHLPVWPPHPSHHRRKSFIFALRAALFRTHLNPPQSSLALSNRGKLPPRAQKTEPFEPKNSYLHTPANPGSTQYALRLHVLRFSSLPGHSTGQPGNTPQRTSIDTRESPMMTTMSQATASSSNPQPQGAEASSDAALLARFLATKDDAAFSQIVQRHGPMVLAVCRRILRNSTDAEDAFQAAFMVLARRAASIDPPHMLGHWLYGVAYRTANKARTTRAIRMNRERQAAPMERPDVTDPAVLAEIQAIVDQEVQRLPRTYRAPIIACHLQGLSRAQAAKQLDLNEGTLSSRLNRGKEMLADRLRKLGYALPAAALLLLLQAPSSTAATVSSSLVASTTTAATAYAAGSTAAASPSILALAEATLHTFFIAKIKLTALVAAALLVVTTGTVVTVKLATQDDAPAPTPSTITQDNQAPPAPIQTTPTYTGTPGQ